MRRLCAMALMLATALVWAEQTSFSPAEEARYQSLISELRCLVCQNQTIAESSAPLAQDLRREVQDLMRAGRSNAEITRYLTERYGDFVLYRPPLKRSTWVLWLGPFVLLALGLLIALLLFRRGRVVATPAIADPEKVKRILEDMQP